MSLKASGSRQKPGIFRGDDGKRTKIWLDPRLPNRSDLVALIELHGATSSLDYTYPSTTMMILHPTSINIFDRYCHPTWLPVGRQSEGNEEWRRKVIITSAWPGKCIAAGRMLREGDDWGGCRKGGPPKASISTTDIPIITSKVATQPEPTSSRPIAALPKRHSPPPSTSRSAIEGQANMVKLNQANTGISFARALSGATKEPKMRVSAQASASKPVAIPVVAKAVKSDVKSSSASSSQLGPAAARLAHFAKAPAGKNDEIHRLMASEAVDMVLRRENLLSFQPGKEIKFVIAQIAKKHPTLSEGTWKKKYLSWRTRKGELAYTTEAATISKYSQIYPKYLPLVIAGKTLEEISTRIHDQNPKEQLSKSDWSILFSDWLRTTQLRKNTEAKNDLPNSGEERFRRNTEERGELEEEEEEVDFPASGSSAKGPFYPKGSDIPFNTQGQADRYKAKIRLARIYKKNFDSWGHNPPDIGRRVHVLANLSESTATSYYTLWRTGKPFFETIPLEYQFSGVPATTSTSPQKKKQKRVKEAEEDDTERRLLQNEKMPLATLDEVIRDAHLISVQHDDIKFGLDHLIQKYPQYNKTTWPAHYRDWRKGIRRFATFPFNNNHSQYSILFTSLFPLVKKGISLNDISERLVKEHAKYGHSTAVWNELFGNWLRTAEMAKSCDFSHINIEAVRLARERRLKLAEIFKRDYDSRDIKVAEVSRAVANETTHSPAHVDGVYRRWRKRAIISDFLPDHLKASPRDDSDQRESESRNRSRSVSTSSSLLSTKPKRLDTDWAGEDVIDLCDSDDSDADSLFSS